MGAFDQRPTFFEGQYLTAADLTAVIAYLRTAQARQMLGANTWGIGIGLALVERDAPGQQNRKEVILQPGWARDGCGRHLVLQQPTRLPETLFASIAYNASLDDPALSGGPPGRLVKVWLAATELGGQQPAPGFQTCDQANAFSRIEEGVDFVVGSPPLASQRSPVVIGADTVDALKALIQFDASAPPLYDTSVPHQTFFADDRPPRWLVPLGFVRWVVLAAGGGYFVDRNLVATDDVEKQIRAARRYGGTVTENVEAADGAIVLRRRSDAPDAPHRFAALLTGDQTLAALLDDLVWVEGNLRIEGDAKLAGSRLLLRNADGLDEGSNLALTRAGDGALAQGARQLRALIGPDSQTDNRFVVGPETSTAPNQKPMFVVQSNGRVGVNQLAPDRTLHAKGDAIRIEDAAGQKRLEMCTDGTGVGLQSDTDAVQINATGPAATHANQVVINSDKSKSGEVGIGTASPAYGLDVDEAAVRFKLDSGNGGQLLLHSESAATATDKVYLEASNGAGNAVSPELRITGKANANLPTFAAYADVTYLTGKLGVGVAPPANDVQVHVRGTRLRVESSDTARSIDLRTDGSDVDVQTTTSHLYLRSTTTGGGTPVHHIVMNPNAGDGNVGIGTAAPAQKLHVAGEFIQIDGAGGEQAYLGGDGSMTAYGSWLTPALDVQLGSFNTNAYAVHCWNIGGNRWMDLICDHSYEMSDATLKTDIQPLAGGLERLQKMRGVSYRMKNDPRSRNRVGVIAQEVAAVLPEAVSQSSRGAAVSYSSFVPLLIEAVKELAARVEALEAQVGALKRPGAAPAKALARPAAPTRTPAAKATRSTGKKR